jgi:hypothetical protein
MWLKDLTTVRFLEVDFAGIRGNAKDVAEGGVDAPTKKILESGRGERAN